jgi:hypothetical protein
VVCNVLGGEKFAPVPKTAPPVGTANHRNKPVEPEAVNVAELPHVTVAPVPVGMANGFTVTTNAARGLIQFGLLKLFTAST